ncbi:hypothetical protein H5410_005441 [Solanum commersonii]|uniref:Uncharacterized protein n=1 Tax=Solanum commersonii TaxID=4109 RepID=A0A9J6A890_SOLCO|nr:hypothetical protein H5410_005441 [Solanum commersonii]
MGVDGALVYSTRVSAHDWARRPQSCKDLAGTPQLGEVLGAIGVSQSRSKAHQRVGFVILVGVRASDISGLYLLHVACLKTYNDSCKRPFHQYGGFLEQSGLREVHQRVGIGVRASDISGLYLIHVVSHVPRGSKVGSIAYNRKHLGYTYFGGHSGPSGGVSHITPTRLLQQLLLVMIVMNVERVAHCILRVQLHAREVVIIVKDLVVSMGSMAMSIQLVPTWDHKERGGNYGVANTTFGSGMICYMLLHISQRPRLQFFFDSRVVFLLIRLLLDLAASCGLGPMHDLESKWLYSSRVQTLASIGKWKFAKKDGIGIISFRRLCSKWMSWSLRAKGMFLMVLEMFRDTKDW